MIKEFLGVYRQELLRLFRNYKIYIALVLYIIVSRITPIMGMSDGTATAVYGMMAITSISNFNKLLVILAAFPFSLSFCEDLVGNYGYYVVSRSSKRVYCLTKMVTCVLTSFAISFIGLLIYSVYNALCYGIGDSAVQVGDIFYGAVSGGWPFLYVLIHIFLFAIVSAVYAVMGMALSAVIPNKFVAIAAPLFMNTLMEPIMNALPGTMSLFRIQVGNSAFQATGALTVVYSVLVCLGYILISGLVFFRYAGKRLSHDIT